MEQTVYGILIPFLGTALGASAVFFMRRQLSDAVQRILTGFAAGVMVAASVWSLLIPAMEQAAWMGKLSFLPAFAGFWTRSRSTARRKPVYTGAQSSSHRRPRSWCNPDGT